MAKRMPNLPSCAHARGDQHLHEEVQGSLLFMDFLISLLGVLNPLSMWIFVAFSNLRRDAKISLLWSHGQKRVLIDVSLISVFLLEGTLISDNQIRLDFFVGCVPLFWYLSDSYKLAKVLGVRCIQIEFLILSSLLFFLSYNLS